MKNVVLVVLVFVGSIGVASAQTPAAPGVRIADAAQPTTLLIDAAVKCAAIGDKDTRKFCLNLVKIEAERGKKVANEAADAAKAARPVVVNPYGYGYGYGYGSGYGGYYGGYYGSYRPRGLYGSYYYRR